MEQPVNIGIQGAPKQVIRNLLLMDSSAAAAACTATGAVQDGAGPCRVGGFAWRYTTTTLTFIGPSVGVGASVLVALVGVCIPTAHFARGPGHVLLPSFAAGSRRRRGTSTPASEALGQSAKQGVTLTCRSIVRKVEWEVHGSACKR
ncbi:hypothetical protein VCV18_007360 [Metarhizium anisopliae]